MKKSFALSVIFLTACQSVPTPLITAPPQANAAQLVQVSQFRTPLFYLEAPLYDPEVKEWIPQKFLDQVQQSIEATVNYPYTETQLQRALSNQLTGDEMQQVINFYQSSVGQAILSAESTFKERININTPPIENHKKIVTATQLQAALHRIFMSSADALITRLDSYNCLAIMQIPGSNIGLHIAKRNKANFMEAQITRALAHLYDNVSEADLMAYLQFAQSPVGQKYFAARVVAMNTIGVDFGERVAEAIAPALPSCVGSFKVSS
jgi:hypothetical protein